MIEAISSLLKGIFKGDWEDFLGDWESYNLFEKIMHGFYFVLFSLILIICIVFLILSIFR